MPNISEGATWVNKIREQRTLLSSNKSLQRADLKRYAKEKL